MVKILILILLVTLMTVMVGDDTGYANDSFIIWWILLTMMRVNMAPMLRMIMTNDITTHWHHHCHDHHHPNHHAYTPCNH